MQLEDCDDIQEKKKMMDLDDPNDLKLLLREQLDECFRIFDINQDNTISKDEMIEIFKMMTGMWK